MTPMSDSPEGWHVVLAVVLLIAVCFVLYAGCGFTILDVNGKY